MNSTVQKIGLVVVVMCLVAGVAFVRNWMPSQGPGGPSADNKAGSKLEETRIDFKATTIRGVPEYELNSTSVFDFWFRNNNAFPVEMGLEKKSCKCTRVEALVLTEDEDSALPEAVKQPDSMEASPRGDVHFFRDEPARWQALMDPREKEHTTVTVPASRSGVVRLSWKGEKLGPVRVTATFWVQLEGNPRTRGGYAELQVPAKVVDPIQVNPPDAVKIPDLEPGQHQVVEFLCWSSTRPRFTLTAKVDPQHPCYLPQCTSLAGAEFKKAAAALKDKTQAEALCAYRVVVTVNERIADGHQLDLGPFLHKVNLASDLADFPVVSPQIRGVVRGEVKVGTEDDRDKIVLKAFSAKKGIALSVPVETSVPGLKLELESKSPAFLEARLTSGDEPMHWNLEVKVPPNQCFGRLPPDSAVILKTQSQHPRRIRIPVLGKGTLD
jgi:hypothetical protein